MTEKIMVETSAPDVPAAETALRVLRSLRQITHALDVQSKKLSRDVGLSAPQLIVLQAVGELGEVTTKTVAGHVSLSQATITTILDRLERLGMVKRYRSKKDRRVVHTRLTAAGKHSVDAAPPLLQENFIAAFEALPPKRRAEIITALHDVGAMMSADGSDAPSVITLASSNIGP